MTRQGPRIAAAGAVVLVLALVPVAMRVVPDLLDPRGGGGEIRWNPGSPPPLTARLDADEREDFVGAYRRDPGVDAPLRIGAFGGAERESLWELTLGEGARFVRAWAMESGILAALDNEERLYVIDASSGELRATRERLPRRTGDLCVAEDGRSAWLEVFGAESLLIDLTAAGRSPAERPAWCPDVPERRKCWTYVNTALGVSRHGCSGEAPPIPESDDFRPTFALGDDSGALVAVGHTPAEEYTRPAAAAFVGERRVWLQPVGTRPDARPESGPAQLADLAGGRLVVQYGIEGKRWRLAAFDAREGTPLWDVEVPDAFGGGANRMTLTETRIYLPVGERLEVFDASTGAHLARLGRR